MNRLSVYFLLVFGLLVFSPAVLVKAAGCGDGTCGTFEVCGQVNECESDCGPCYTVFDEPLCKINEWEPRVGDQKGAVLDIDTVNDSLSVTAALATNGFGVFTTGDHGKSFRQLISSDLLGKRIYTVRLARDYLVGPIEAVYVGTDDGVWRWLDNGPWVNVLATTSPVYALALAEDFGYNSSGEQHIYAGIGGQGMFFSNDKGNTWLDLSSGLGTHLYLRDIRLTPGYTSDVPTELIAVSAINPKTQTTGGGRIHRFVVGNGTWISHLLPDGATTLYALTMSPKIPFTGHIWVGGLRGKLFFTTDITQGTPVWQSGLAVDKPITSLDISPFAIPVSSTWAPMLIGTTEGMFQSNDGGTTISNQVLADRLVLTAKFPSFFRISSNQLVYAGTTTGFVVGTFGQANCNPKERSRGVDNISLEDLAVAPNFPADPAVFAVSSSLGLLKSVDKGQNFVAMNNFRTKNSNQTTTPEAVALDLANSFQDTDPAGPSKHLYLATAMEGVFRSDDGGWSGVQVLGSSDELDTPESMMGTSIDVSPNYASGTSDGTVIYGTAEAGVWQYDHSTDSWCQLAEETIDGGCPGACASACTQLPSLMVHDVQVSNVFDGTSVVNGVTRTMFAATESGLYRTMNGGDNWAEMNVLTLLPEEPVLDVAVSPALNVDGTVFAVVRGLGVYRSTNAGSGTPNWSKMNLGVSVCDACVTHVSLAPDFGTGSGRLAVGTIFGNLFYSTDGGDNWSQASGTGLPSINKQVRMLEVTMDTASTGTNAIWVGYPGQAALLSENGGTTFVASEGYTTLPKDVDSMAFATTTDPSTGETPLWATSPSTGLFVSFDSGQSWRPFTQMHDGGSNPFLGAMGLATTVEDTLCDGQQESLLVGTIGKGLHAFRFVGRDFRQANPAQTFSSQTTGVFTEITAFPEAVCGNSDPIYASSPVGFNKGLFKSTDGGLNWTKINVAQVANSTDSAFGDDGVAARPSALDGLDSTLTIKGLQPIFGGFLPGPLTKVSSIIWSSSFTEGVSVSNNDGVDWVDANGLPPNHLPNDAANTVIQLASTIVLTGLDPNSGSFVGGVFWTPDEGVTTWIKAFGLDATTLDVQEFAEVEANNDLLVVIQGSGGASDGGVFLSGDSGQHWIDLGTNLDPSTQTVTDVIASAEVPVTYYIGTAEDGVWANSIEANPYPTVTSLNITSGAATGGDLTTITGTNFDDGDGDPVCVFGGVDTPGTFVNSTTVTCTTPLHLSGLVDVGVRNADTRLGVLADGFTFTGNTGTGSLVLSRDGGSGDITIGWSGSMDGIFEVQRSTDPSDFSGATSFFIYYGTDFIDEEASGDGITYYYRVQ